MPAWFDRLRAHGSAAVDRPLLGAEELVELARRGGGTPLPAGREAAHSRLGEVRSPFRGRGMDFDESRPFQQGDDRRFMDWRLTARAGRPYIKLFREERRPTVFVLVDRRAAMRFGTRVRLKAAQGARAAALVGFAAQRKQAAVAGLLLEAPLHWLPPSNAPDAPLRLAHAAASPAPPVAPSAKPALAEVLGLLARSLQAGTELWLISDFRDLDAACRPLLFRLEAEHQVRAVHVVDPAELALPRAGTLRLFPTGGGHGVSIASEGPAARRFAAAAAAHMEQRRSVFAGLGIPYCRVQSDTDAIERELPL